MMKTLDFHSPLTLDRRERAARIAAYGSFLEQRDGEPDAAWTSLRRRSEAMRRLSVSTVHFRGAVDADLFREQYLRYSPSRATPDEMLLVLSFVKLNQNEAYAVGVVDRAGTAKTDLDRRVLLQETYHTRILLSAAGLFGLAVPGPLEPPWALRPIIHLLAHLPRAAMHVVALANEIIGLVLFTRLLESTRRVMRDQPELRDALEERVVEVLIDEVGHTSFNRLLSSDCAMAWLPRLLQLFVMGYRQFYPELARVSGKDLSVADVMSISLAHVRESVRRRAFVE